MHGSSTEQGALVRAAQDRFDQPFEFLDATFYVTVSAQDTGGLLCSVDTNRHMRGGPPLHVHPDQDEWFLIREGEFDIRVGDVTHHLTAGDSLLAPRGVPHAFVNTTEAARMQVSFVPAGLMEGFFHTACAMNNPTPQAMAQVFADHQMRVVGPPLPVN